MLSSRPGKRLISAVLVMSAMVVLLPGCASTPAKIVREHESAAGCPYCKQAPAKTSLVELAELVASPPPSVSQHALGHFVAAWQSQRHCQLTGTLESTPLWRVRFQTSGGSYPLDYFDEVVPARDMRIVGITKHSRAGIGVPLSAFRKNTKRETIEEYYPPEGITRALTAVASVKKLPDGS